MATPQQKAQAKERFAAAAKNYLFARDTLDQAYQKLMAAEEELYRVNVNIAEAYVQYNVERARERVVLM